MCDYGSTIYPPRRQVPSSTRFPLQILPTAVVPFSDGPVFAFLVCAVTPGYVLTSEDLEMDVWFLYLVMPGTGNYSVAQGE